jgi:hypothetical protein
MALASAHTSSLGVISIIIILSAITASIALTEFGIGGIAQGQAGTMSLTPQQKEAMCDPSNPKLKVVNMTESKICGIPVTIKVAKRSAAASTATTSSENNTSSSILPLIVP